MKPNSFLTLLAGGAAAAALAVSVGASVPAIGATPPPSPPPLAEPSASPAADASAAPVPVPSGFAIPNGPGYGSPAPGPSVAPTPPPNARKGVEGVWEVQIQRGSNTEYTHLVLSQDGTTIGGNYVNSKGKKFPLAGTLDGQTVRIVITLPDGTSLTLEGRLDGTTDMIGEFTSPKEQVPFTAAYRAKSKFIDNLNAAPGGMGSGGGGYGAPP